MNCKLGDMAIIVKSYRGNEGKIVKIISYAGVIYFGSYGSFPSWNTDKKLSLINMQESSIIPDFQLRPIRPSDEKDEMLRIVGLPNKEKEKA